MSSNRVKIGFSGIEYHSKTMRCQLNHCTFLNTRLSKGKLFGDVKICMKIFIVDHQNLKLLKEQDFLSKRLRFFDSDDVRCKQLQFLVPSERVNWSIRAKSKATHFVTEPEAESGTRSVNSVVFFSWRRGSWAVISYFSWIWRHTAWCCLQKLIKI